MDSNAILSERAQYSRKRLQSLKKRVSRVGELRKIPGLCVYVTGSYGRLEASKRSDLDLFFVYEPNRGPVNNLTKTMIAAKLIEITRDLNFPEFSNEGQYLQMHSLNEMLETLGGPEDDYKNYFTARLLLLLESRPVYNPSSYDKIIGRIVKAYFRDYHGHEKDFRPIFLVNDILRYWKTICLNYEHKRNNARLDSLRKNKNHLRNLKLKFSRVLTCFSMVIALCASATSRPAEIIRLVRLSPMQRIREATHFHEQNEARLHSATNDYAWFLKTTARKGILNWIGSRSNRDEGFSRARAFDRNMFSILSDCAEGKDTLRFLVI
jgi:predicted nucleotidyltransferase